MRIIILLQLVIAVVISNLAYQQSILALEESTRVLNWETVYTPAIHNIGKVKALLHLARKGESLDHINLSCEAMNGSSCEVKDDKKPDDLTYLRGLNLSEENVGLKIELRAGIFSKTDMGCLIIPSEKNICSDFSGANLEHTDFEHSILEHADFF